jgi:hypothetical protein
MLLKVNSKKYSYKTAGDRLLCRDTVMPAWARREETVSEVRALSASRRNIITKAVII